MEAHKITVKIGFDLVEFKTKNIYKTGVSVLFFHTCELFNSPTARLINFHTCEKKLYRTFGIRVGSDFIMKLQQNFAVLVFHELDSTSIFLFCSLLYLSPTSKVQQKGVGERRCSLSSKVDDNEIRNVMNKKL
jgi:hypothetical protein